MLRSIATCFRTVTVLSYKSAPAVMAPWPASQPFCVSVLWVWLLSSTPAGYVTYRACSWKSYEVYLKISC